MKTAVVGVQLALCVLFYVLSFGAPGVNAGGGSGSSIDISSDLFKDHIEALRKFDINNDGQITMDEFISAMRSLKKYSEKDIQKMAGIAFLQDESGKIDYYIIMQILKEALGASLKQFFEIIDVDRNGSLSTDDVGYVLRKLGYDVTDEELHEMIEEGDTDEDGNLNCAEFGKRLTKK